MTRLASLLAAGLLPATTGWVSSAPASILREHGNLPSVTKAGRSSSEYRATRAGGKEGPPLSWTAAEITAAREALINSPDFQTLVDRLGGTVFEDDPEFDNMSTIRTGWGAAALPGFRADSADTTEATATSTALPTTNEGKKRSWSPANLWDRNSNKLESLRTTVMESEKAREIKKTLRSGDSRSTIDTMESDYDAVPPAAARSVAPAFVGAAHSVVWSGGHRRGDRGESGDDGDPTASGVQESASSSSDEATAGVGAHMPTREGPPGIIRWIRRVASKASNVGIRARGRVARIVGRGEKNGRRN